MNRPIISVDNLSKRYTLRHQQGGYRTLRDTLADKARSMLGRNGPAAPAAREEFWALKDVSFEVNRGDVVGIIGRNGAGKSTLLKILSRITEPTSGTIRLGGRVASLLEVGTGFHPELTGRENIFLNGAILGMTKAEIRSKFDEIVAFAEVEKFLDTPVKHYSSGMYVRLAFAVAAHLDPEILVVDEVLAVGDGQFQKKCLGKMQEVAANDRTVLFVSHTMAAVSHLCSRAIVLSHGSLAFSGTAVEGVHHYLASLRQRHETRSAPGPARCSPDVRIHSVHLERNMHPCAEFLFGDTAEIVIALDVTKPTFCGLEFVIRDSRDAPIAFSPSSSSLADFQLRPGLQELRCQLPPLNLANGGYSIDALVVASGKSLIEEFPNAAHFTVDGAVLGTTRWDFSQNLNRGCILWHGSWSKPAGI